MEKKKKFIMKFGITVCLLAVLFSEGLFLYCRYVKHTTVPQYVAEKLHIAQSWISHSGTQTANANPPAAKSLPAVKPAAPERLLLPTAGDALRETLERLASRIPERRPTDSPLPVSSNSDTEAETDSQPEEAPEKETPAAEAEIPPPEKNVSDASSEPEITDIHDLLKRQADAGLDPNADSFIQLEAESILQYPELPTGCEVTSLAMALRFAGFDVSKEELADQFLDKASPGTVSYTAAFWGDPRQPDSFGCYAPVIVHAANKYLESQAGEPRAYNLTGASLDELLEEVRMGEPVIVWGSMYIDEEIVFSYGWEIEGETVTWPSNEHCMLLIGFDLENNSVIVCDPLSGIVSYDKNAFQRHYDTLERQAIVIY